MLSYLSGGNIADLEIDLRDSWAAAQRNRFRRTKMRADLRDRKKAMEDQYFQDAERTLKLKSRRDRLLAKWIAGLIDRKDLAGYADEITDARFKGGDLGVLSKALSDLRAAGHNISEQDVAAKMSEFMVEAAEQL